MAESVQPSAVGYNWAALLLGEINTGTWPSRLGESKKLRQWDSDPRKTALTRPSNN
jgi:hypothetical protein